jgi:hypothetical protein
MNSVSHKQHNVVPLFIDPKGRMYKHIFDRSNLDQNVAFNPKTKVHKTRRDELKEAMMPRADVVLLNGTRSGKEYALYVTKGGYKGDTWILDVLTDEEYDQVEEIAERMRRNADEFPPAWKLL